MRIENKRIPVKYKARYWIDGILYTSTIKCKINRHNQFYNYNDDWEYRDIEVIGLIDSEAENDVGYNEGKDHLNGNNFGSVILQNYITNREKKGFKFYYL